MRGSIQQRGKSSWRIRVELEPHANGERNRHTETFNGTRAEAQKRLTEL
jgi:hypothetical protein